MAGFENLALARLTDSDGAFVLSSTAWEQLRLGIATIAQRAQQVAAIKADVRQAATSARELAATWQHQIEPRSLAFASSLSSLGGTLAARYQSPDDLLALLQGALREQARERVRAALADVYTQARGCQSIATELCAIVAAQASAAQELHHLLVTLAANYEAAINQNDARVRELRPRIAQFEQEVAQRQAAYNHYVTVAATTPSYGWIPIVGWIAGGVVAGTYGAKAAQEKQALDAANQELAVLRAKLDQCLVELYTLQDAGRDSRALAEAFSDVTPLLSQIQGLWDALASDLDGIGDAAEDDLNSERLIELRLALQHAANGWAEVARQAAGYAANSAAATPQLLAA
ncbi:MAG: hypothetical protein OHK0022_12670 [Roseiflexaceae bacterium]